MGQFTASPDVMMRAVQDMVTARTAIDAEMRSVAATSAGTLRAWRGAGGDALRSLMARYDVHAAGLQQALDRFQQMLAEQAAAYQVSDALATEQLSRAGGSLQI